MPVGPVRRNFLRYQIRQYLTNHLDIPPKAVLLVGVLQPLGGLSGEAARASQASGSSGDSVAAVESSSNGGSGGSGSSEAAGERATSGQPAPEATAGSGSTSSDGSWSTGSSSTSSSPGSAPSRLLVTPQAAAEMDAAAAAATAAMFFPLPSDGGAGASAATTSSDDNEGASTDQERSSAGDGVAAEDGLVVGVVEVRCRPGGAGRQALWMPMLSMACAGPAGHADCIQFTFFLDIGTRICCRLALVVPLARCGGGYLPCMRSRRRGRDG